MIDLKKVKKVSKGHGSFAVWREGDINDVSIIEEKNKELHGRVIFVGYNASKHIPPFKNFHFVHQGGRDGWLDDSINRNPHLRGAYMTDFFKGDHSVREAGVRVNPKAIQKNLSIFKQEISLFKDDNPVLVAFGDNTHNLLNELGFNVEYLPHYARRGLTRRRFVASIRELSRKLYSK